jgi:hypothetical protein
MGGTAGKNKDAEGHKHPVKRDVASFVDKVTQSEWIVI